ncbi:unnamed protein product [Mycena citricolor]|uniref:Protoporphyrinogen oxidase n=1 Tax=Mycena citricolor TaxID=2018698 RepID=A0AAD2GY34_9AGAR|nr:unnamed protein product [Mycena citricolor]
MPPQHIAILGGGLSGLSSAFHLSRRFPTCKITIIEKNKQLGGWAANTARVPLPGGRGTVVLEGGPRTLRPNSNAVLELINLLGLSDALLTTPKSSAAAKRRFLHVPGTPGIWRIPGPTLSFLWSELRFFITPGLVNELVRGWNRPADIVDESLESFLTRRMHPVTARILGSALVHGIYATDARLLSVRAAFPKLWEMEEKGNGRLLWGLLTRSRQDRNEEKLKVEEDRQRYELGDVMPLVEGAAVFSFRDGMSSLPQALTRAIRQNPNVGIMTETEIESLQLNEEGFEITTKQTNPVRPSHVVSALPLPILHQLLPATHELPYLRTNPYSSVTSINLVFPGKRIWPRGFGYLVPRPQNDYAVDEAGILGVVFDSEALSGQDNLAPGEQITKVTVMMGGPHRNVDTRIPVVLAHLQYQLNRSKPFPEPLAVKVWENRHCIPMPMPGHLVRMERLQEALKGDLWQGRIEVIGAGVKGVSVGDCIESGRNVGLEW